MLTARCFVLLQRLLPQHTLSRLIHALARSRARWLKDLLIGTFVRGFRPALEEAAQPDARAYASFNEFFTRALAPGARPLEGGPRAVVSPVDGTVSQIGYLKERQLIQAKGHSYLLDALLGAHAQWAEHFVGGAYATLYLAPYNYHRIHMPVAGALRAAWYVPGRLFSVNGHTAAALAGLFARNERVVCAFETSPPAAPHPFALVLVGALFVGSITTRWHDEVTPRRPRHALDLGVPADATLAQGAEMGRFNMGSTVILLFPPGSVRWHPELAAGNPIRMGQGIGEWLAA
jgi:phosphatidylserine decarboxylase